MKQWIEGGRQVFAALVALAVAHAQALTVTWDADSGTTGAQDGGGSWSTVSTNWWDGATDAVVIGRDGGSGTVVQNGGLFRLGKATYVGASSFPQTTALYTMNDGVLDLTGQTLGLGLGLGSGTITGALNQVGGVITNVGTLKLGSDGAVGTGSYTLGGGTICIGSGGISSQSGKYSLNLGGGVLVASAGWTSTLNMNLTNLNGVVTFNTAGNAVTLGGVLSGNGGLIKKGLGTLTMTNANTYSGGTMVTGDVAIAHSQALGSGSVIVTNSARLLLSGNLTVTNSLALFSEAPVYNNQLLSSSGSNIWVGPLRVSGSSIAASGGSTLRLASGIVGTSYCSFSAGGNIILDTRPISLTNQTVYFGGSSSGTIRLNVGGSVFGTANFWGGVTLLPGLENALPSNMAITANNAAGGKLDLNGYHQSVGTLNQNSTYPVTITNSGSLATLTVNQSANTAFAGAIRGNLRLVKSGTGVLTLTNTCNPVGGTIVSNGMLRLGLANALPLAGSVEVAGGVYDLGGYTVTNASVLVRNGIGVINGVLAAGTVELAGTGTVQVALGGSGGLVKSGAGTADLISATTYGGSTLISGGTLRLEPLPSETVAFYGFDDSANLGADRSTRGNTLKTLSGTPQYSASGKFGGALYLNGSTTLGTLSGQFPTGVPTGAAPYTVSAFVKADAGCPVQGGWIGYGNGATGQSNNFRLGGAYTNVWEYWWANDMGANMVSGSSFTDGWHSVVGTWDGTTETIYIDGAYRASRTASGLNVGTANFVVGKTIGDANFKGWVDELLIASRSLSAAEVAALNAASGISPRSLPAGTALQVDAGAALDLNRIDQTVASLSGNGTVTGGTLTVTGRLSAGAAVGAIGALSVQSGLTLAAGVTNAVDCTSSSADVVNVRGTLTLLGSGTVLVSPADPANPTSRVTLFTFDTLAGGVNLSSWTIAGVKSGYTTRLTAGANAIVLSISPAGTLLRVF